MSPCAAGQHERLYAQALGERGSWGCLAVVEVDGLEAVPEGGGAQEHGPHRPP
jgi:hypothetical protein